MVRGLILGALAFGAVFAAERRFDALGKDVARYNAMREMSGDPPLLRQIALMAFAFIKNYRAGRPGGTADALTSLARDAVRYAVIRVM